MLVHISSHLIPHALHCDAATSHSQLHRALSGVVPVDGIKHQLTYSSGVCSQHCNTARSCDAVDVIVFHLMIEGSGLPVTQLCEPNRVSQYLADKKS